MYNVSPFGSIMLKAFHVSSNHSANPYMQTQKGPGWGRQRGTKLFLMGPPQPRTPGSTRGNKNRNKPLIQVASVPRLMVLVATVLVAYLGTATPQQCQGRHQPKASKDLCLFDLCNHFLQPKMSKASVPLCQLGAKTIPDHCTGTRSWRKTAPTQGSWCCRTSQGTWRLAALTWSRTAPPPLP